MARKANAADITQILSLLGGGSKKNGGDGMAGGMGNLYLRGFEDGNKLGLKGIPATEYLKNSDGWFQIEDKNDRRK